MYVHTNVIFQAFERKRDRGGGEERKREVEKGERKSIF